MKNPFQFGRDLEPEALVDRDDEVRAVTAVVLGSGTLFLIGPRRHGKTSILRAAAARATEAGAVVLRYNAEAFPTLEHLAARIVADAASQLTTSPEKARQAIGSLFSRARPTASFNAEQGRWAVTFGRESGQPVGAALLADVLDGANRAAEQAGKPVGILLDEFQAIVEEGGAEAEGQICAAAQAHRHVGHVFAGSAPPRPFYKLREVHAVGPLPRNDFAVFIDRGFLRGGIATAPGAVDAILDVAADVPYNVQQLAHACWEACREDGSRHPSALTPERVHAVARVTALNLDPLYAQLWTSLPATQRKAVLALVRERGRGLTSADVALRYDLPVASMQKALASLQTKGIIREELGRSGIRLRLHDPLFGTWLAAVVPT